MAVPTICCPGRLPADLRLARRQAATSGEPRFFLGTDSAPHPRAAKEAECGCAGIDNAPFALESNAEVFEQEGGPRSPRGLRQPAWAGLLRPASERRHDHSDAGALTVPPRLHANAAGGAATDLVPFHSGQVLHWRVAEPG
jgi:dihydroorotase